MCVNQQGCWLGDVRNPVRKQCFGTLKSDCVKVKGQRGCAFFYLYKSLPDSFVGGPVVIQ